MTFRQISNSDALPLSYRRPLVVSPLNLVHVTKNPAYCKDSNVDVKLFRNDVKFKAMTKVYSSTIFHST